MRNSSFDSGRFADEVRRRGKKARENFLTDAALVNPTLESSFLNCIRIKTNEADVLVLLAILSWYMDPGVSILFRLEISEKIEHNLDLSWIEFLLQSEPEMIQFLQWTSKWDTWSFFGNLFTEKNIRRALRFCSLSRKSKRKPKRKVRRRGYQDKGTWRAPHEHHSFYDGTKEQIALEIERESYRSTFLLLAGFLE